MRVIHWVALLVALFPISSVARDLDGRYANSPLKSWFDNLSSKSGVRCCSDADGRALSDVDWRTTPDGKHYEGASRGQVGQRSR